MAHRFRLYPTAAQADVMTDYCTAARKAWNLGIEQFEFAARYHRGDRKAWPSTSQRSRDLTEARAEFDWFAAVPRVVQAQALRDLDRAFKNWWNNPAHFGRPTFRKAGRGGGFEITDVARRSKIVQINRRWATIDLPKLGPVKFRLTRSFALLADAKSARVTVDKAGRWHVSFPALPTPVDRVSTGAVVGIDRGVVNTLATSDGRFDHAPTLSHGEQSEFVRRQAERAYFGYQGKVADAHKRAVARTYVRLADRRNDWVEQSTTRLVRDYDVIVVERLNVRGMTRSASGTVEAPGRSVRAKAGLNRAILAQCWGRWLQRLKEKAALCGVVVIEVPAAGTSQTCRGCGHRDPGNRDSQAVFRCVRCGHEDHADVNAAKIILARGLEARTGPEPLGVVA